MPEIEITLPAEAPVELGFVANALPGRLTVNTALRNFEPRQVFRWHLSVWIECQDMDADRLPSTAEQQLLRDLELNLHQALAADGNALFAARLSHDGGREFSWRLDDDPHWAQLTEYLNAGTPSPQHGLHG